jgi:hypothetical protein
MILSISASQVARITGVSHWNLAEALFLNITIATSSEGSSQNSNPASQAQCFPKAAGAISKTIPMVFISLPSGSCGMFNLTMLNVI